MFNIEVNYIIILKNLLSSIKKKLNNCIRSFYLTYQILFVLMVMLFMNYGEEMINNTFFLFLKYIFQIQNMNTWLLAKTVPNSKAPFQSQKKKESKMKEVTYSSPVLLFFPLLLSFAFCLERDLVVTLSLDPRTSAQLISS